MSAEISGDSRLTVAQRLSYLAFNLGRNLKPGKCTAQRLRFSAERLPRTPSTASPGRALTEAFLHSQLPKMLPPGKLRVLEIGCGSGSLTKLLTEFGYSGSYVGVDIVDRFDRAAQSSFRRDFVLADAHRFEPDGQFDLVISVSALEHIPEDRRLIDQLAGYVAPGGLQVHFVPSGWGLLTYLWHGYRQYTAVSLDERFDSQRTSIFSMGGAASFMLHFLFITVGEILLRLRLRQRLPRLYSRILDGCLRSDRLVPLCGTMYAVCQTTTSVSD
ncbi:MAG: class I SAM-dependent methyltransferase [Sulfuritalea sp.]|nr:class I SAM-dependent methyltransferase [Sulfuritalea sp.]